MSYKPIATRRGASRALFCLGCSALALAFATPVLADSYYFADGEQISLTPSRRHLAVRLLPGSDLDLAALYPREIDPTRRRHLVLHRLELYDLRAGLDAARLETLTASVRVVAEIDLVAPVFVTGDALMIVTDEFVARTATGVTAAELADLNRAFGVEVVQSFPWDDRVLVLRAVAGDALATANAYHRLPEIDYAHPNFVRVGERRPARAPDPGERVVVGPGGRRLPGDTVVPKGSNEYLVTEPASDDVPATGTPGTAPAAPVSGATIQSEGFEGAFPGSWDVTGDPTWGPVTHRAYAGSSSGYCVGSSVAPPGPYPNDVAARMTYGPFDLSDAVDARVTVQTWMNTESGWDFFTIFASAGGDFWGTQRSGDLAGETGGDGWANIGFDLKRVPTLGDLTGEPRVWVRFKFASDSVEAFEGVYLDEIVIEKITGGYRDLTSDVFDHLQWSLDNNGQLWGVEGADVRADEAWGLSHGSSAVTVAIVDEGVDLSHPDLAGKLVAGYDATGSGSGGAPSGNDAHGTACAGIAAAVTDNALGVAGIARAASLMPVRVAYDDGSGWVTSDSWLADGISWATANGADVLNNSWGGGTPVTVIDDAIVNAKTNGRGGKGAVVVFAAGNDNGPVHYPATHPQVLAVGALSPCDERTSPTSCDAEHWWGSNFGPALDIAAPGVHMYTTDIVGASGYSSGDYDYDFGGTSSSAPVVAGVAALLLGYSPDLTAQEVESRLTSTADDLGAPGRDDLTGWGRVNAYEALSAAPPPSCYRLTLEHTGEGSDPAALPPKSDGCAAAGEYYAGELIGLTASPDPGRTVSGWTGSDDDGSTSIFNAVTMPAADHTVSVAYAPGSPTCYLLSRSHTGSGADPAAFPAASLGCAAGRYQPGQPIELTAGPAPGWTVSGWSGTSNDASTALTNGLTMPAADHPVAVHYAESLEQFRISDMGPDGSGEYDAAAPAVAYNWRNDQYLVVWHGDDDTDGTDDEREIYGRRLDASTGQRLGGDLRISRMGPVGGTAYEAVDPAVAYNPVDDLYLVVWAADHHAGGMVEGEFEIFGQHVRADGTLAGLRTRISTMGGSGDADYDASEPSVAYNVADHEYLVAWAADDDTPPLVNGEFEIYAQRLDASSLSLLGGRIGVSEQGAGLSTYRADRDALRPHVAYNAIDNEYLVAWQGVDAVAACVWPCVGSNYRWFEIFAQRLAADGGELGGDQRLSLMTSVPTTHHWCYQGAVGYACHQGYCPRVAHNPIDNEYLVVWHGDDYADSSGLEYEIHGQRLSASGTEIGADDFQISAQGVEGGAYDAFWPDVVYVTTTHEYLVVWEGDDVSPMADNEFEIFGQRLAGADGAAVDDDLRISVMGPNGDESFDARIPAIGFSTLSHRPLVVWGGDDDTGSLIDDEYEIWGRFLEFLGACGKPQLLDLGPARITKILDLAACTELFVGRGVEIVAPGKLTVAAGGGVALDEMSVEAGCELTVVNP